MALETILGATLIPVLTDLVKSGAGAVTRKFLGLSVDDQIKLDNASIEKLKALASLDTPHGQPSQWVVDLRAASRYVMAAVLILSGVAVALAGVKGNDQGIITLGAEIAGFPFGFLFGERMVLSFRKK